VQDLFVGLTSHVGPDLVLLTLRCTHLTSVHRPGPDRNPASLACFIDSRHSPGTGPRAGTRASGRRSHRSPTPRPPLRYFPFSTRCHPLRGGDASIVGWRLEGVPAVPHQT
jgi:hypothetical protein